MQHKRKIPIYVLLTTEKRSVVVNGRSMRLFPDNPLKIMHVLLSKFIRRRHDYMWKLDIHLREE